MQKLTAATVFAELQGKEIALIGLGVSHRPVAKLLAQKGMKVTIYDKKSPEELGEAAKELPVQLPLHKDRQEAPPSVRHRLQ